MPWLLETFGPDVPFPQSSNVSGASFRELRTSESGQQYRVLYERVGDAFIAYVAFHKTHDRDLRRAVKRAERLRKERTDADP